MYGSVHHFVTVRYSFHQGCN